MVLTSYEYIEPGTRLRKVRGELYVGELFTFVDRRSTGIITVTRDIGNYNINFTFDKFERVDQIPEEPIDDTEVKQLWY